MPEANESKNHVEREFRHRGRGSQIPIYLGKQLRFFINESDWKVLPMAAIIAALVGLVIRNKIFFNMEGTLIGAFALTCVAIWNGCFNSIQAVCRERAIIKREHRSGMHISSYMIAHMIYQFLLCMLQTGISIYVIILMEVRFPEHGFMTPWMYVDIGITMLLISYASDLLSLLISSFSRTTTAAMTVMPFILIFQLVFSGGIIPLPQWIEPLSGFTISTYGMRAIASQSGYNDLPMTSVWKTVTGMWNSEIEETITVGQLLDALNSDTVTGYREESVIPAITVGEAAEYLNIRLPDQKDPDDILNEPVSLGEIIDLLNSNANVQKNRDQSFTLKTTVGGLISLLGEENVKEFIQQKTAEASYNEEYVQSVDNIVRNWLMLLLHMAVYAFIATLLLEFIDKDKR